MKEPDRSDAWSAGVLADLCSLSSASALPVESGAPIYVGLEHVDSGAFNLTRWASPHEFKSNAFIFQRGDVLYGKLRPYLDKAVIAPGAGVCSTELLVLRPLPDVPPEFLLAILHTPEFVAYAQSSADKQYPRTSWSWISQYPINRPSPVEQMKIAALLGKVQAAVALEGDLIRVTRELKQRALRQFFTRGLRGESQKETDIGLVPESWSVAPLRNIAQVVYGAQAAVANAVDPSIGTLILTNVNLTLEGTLDLRKRRYYNVPERHRDRLELREGDVLFNWRSGSQEHVGKTVVFRSKEKTTYSSFILRFRLLNETPPEFLHYYLTHLRTSGYFKEKGSVSSVNTVFNASVAEGLPCWFPSPSEQHEISGMLVTLDAKIAHHEARQKLMRELFRTLLRDLLSAYRSVAALDLTSLAS